MAARVTSGPYKGFWTLPDSILREQLRQDVIVGDRQLFDVYRAYQIALQHKDLVYYRYSPGPGKRIKGINGTLLPYVDGYYYVRVSADPTAPGYFTGFQNNDVVLNPTFDMRRLLFALENELVPASGNTELFNIDYRHINVPEHWRPYLLDPCIEDWCKDPIPQPPPPIANTFPLSELLLFSIIFAVVIATFIAF